MADSYANLIKMVYTLKFISIPFVKSDLGRITF